MPLTEEEKEKIEEEERVRAQARAKYTQPQQIVVKKRRTSNLTWGVVILIVLIGIFSIIYTPDKQTSTSPAETPQTEEKTLKADVKYDMQNLTITKKDNFDWHGCRIQITAGTSGLLGSGVTYEPTIRYNLGQKTGVLPLTEFVDKNGTRFNVFSTKPNNIFIFCTEGSYEGTF